MEALQADLKAIRKDLRKIKALLEDPTGEKSKARVSNNGFNKPLEVSDKLRAFLGLAPDEKISRSQVTKRINEYVTSKNLKSGQVIHLDAALKDLLNPPEGVEVTFLNIQKYINHHYIKATPPPAQTAAPTTDAAAAASSSKKPPVKKKT